MSEQAGLPAAKAALRSRLLAARAAMPADERARASAAICGHLGELLELAGARAILGYAAFGSEASVDAYLTRLADAGVGVFLPFVDGEDLGIARVVDLEGDLAPGWRGVREPRASGRRPARVDRLHAVVAPGVGFDRAGNRLGYGGGHFDRLLAKVPAGRAVVGVGFDAQLVERVPTDAHDRAVDIVVTQSGALRV